MTIGTAMVASTNVRTTGDSVRSQSPRTRLRTVRGGKTASQIITASWCLVGGAGAVERMVMMSPCGGCVRSGRVADLARSRDGLTYVALDQVGHRGIAERSSVHHDHVAPGAGEDRRGRQS